MKIGRLIVRVLSLLTMLFIFLQPIIASVTYAVEPWTGDPWQGKPWEGKPWDAGDLQWDGKSWTGDGTEGSSTEGSSTEGLETDGNNTDGKNSNETSNDSTSKSKNNDENSDRDISDEAEQVENTINYAKNVHMYHNFAATAIPGGISWGYGYKITPRGNKYIVTGARDIHGRWVNSFVGKKLNNYGANRLNNNIGATLDDVYHDERAIKRGATTYNKGTNNLQIQKNFKVSASIKHGLLNNYGDDAFRLANNLKGGGMVGHLLTFGSTYASYGWGKNSAENGGPGVASTDFAAAMITDGALAGGTTVLSSIAASMATSSAIGSVVPGLGTIVGAAVGLGVGLLMSTNVGKRIRNRTKDIVKAGLDKAVDAVKKIGDFVGGLFS